MLVAEHLISVLQLFEFDISLVYAVLVFICRFQDKA